MTRQELENKARTWLHEKVIERCGEFWEKGDDPEDWIVEFCWVKNTLYASINALSNATPIAILGKGLLHE